MRPYDWHHESSLFALLRFAGSVQDNVDQSRNRAFSNQRTLELNGWQVLQMTDLKHSLLSDSSIKSHEKMQLPVQEVESAARARSRGVKKTKAQQLSN